MKIAPSLVVLLSALALGQKSTIKTLDGDMTIVAAKSVSFEVGGETVGLADMQSKIDDLTTKLNVAMGTIEMLGQQFTNYTNETDQKIGDLWTQTSEGLAAVPGQISNAISISEGKTNQAIGGVSTTLNGVLANLKKSTSCSSKGFAISSINDQGAVSCSTKVFTTTDIQSQTTTFMAGYNFYKNKAVRAAIDQAIYPSYTKFISPMDMMIDADESNDNLYFDQTYFCVRQRDADPEAYMTWTLPMGTAMTSITMWDRYTASSERFVIYWSDNYGKMTSNSFKRNYKNVLSGILFNRKVNIPTNKQYTNLVTSQYVADLPMNTAGNGDCYAGAHVTFKRVSFPGV